jgi:hypothetical protein
MLGPFPVECQGELARLVSHHTRTLRLSASLKLPFLLLTWRVIAVSLCKCYARLSVIDAGGTQWRINFVAPLYPLEFGGMEQMKETVLDSLARARFQQMWQDLSYGARCLRRSPGFSITAILVLSLAIGANTAIFSVIEGVLLRPLPYSNPERLCVLWKSIPQKTLNGIGPQLLQFATGASKLRYLRTWLRCCVQKAQRSRCGAILDLKRFKDRLSRETSLIFFVPGLCWAAHSRLLKRSAERT